MKLIKSQVQKIESDRPFHLSIIHPTKSDRTPHTCKKRPLLQEINSQLK